MKIEFGKNNKVIIRIPYNQEFKKKVKSISGRGWNFKGKYWKVPYSNDLIAKLQNFLGENSVIDPYFYLIPLQKELLIKRYSRRTIKSYMRINRIFLLFSGKKPEGMENKDIKKYLYYMAEIYEIKRLKKEKKLPVHIRASKGRKDRYTLLSDIALQILREYWKKEKPKKWLFTSWNKEKHITEKAVQKIFQNACKKAGIKKNISVHSLRLSFAARLLESGIYLKYIQELLDHKSSKTTEIYTYVSTKNLSATKNPLDNLLTGSENKNKKRITDSHPEGCICEQFGYLYNSVGYPNSSGMNELYKIATLKVRGRNK